jgi:hypothetical protein
MLARDQVLHDEVVQFEAVADYLGLCLPSCCLTGRFEYLIEFLRGLNRDPVAHNKKLPERWSDSVRWPKWPGWRIRAPPAKRRQTASWMVSNNVF